jgi:hypothetical protein
VCNVACLITRMWSVCFLSGTLIKSLELCQVLVSHFVTLTEDSAAPGSKSFRIVVQRLKKYFALWRKAWWVLCACVYRRTRLGKETECLIIGNQVTDCLTAWSRVLLVKVIVPRLTNKLCTVYQTQCFTMFARACHMSLSWARSVQSMSTIMFPEDQF